MHLKYKKTYVARQPKKWPYYQDGHFFVDVISKRLKFTLDDRTDTNLIVTLRMHIYRSKSTLDSLKNANVFRWKLSMGAPD